MICLFCEVVILYTDSHSSPDSVSSTMHRTPSHHFTKEAQCLSPCDRVSISPTTSKAVKREILLPKRGLTVRNKNHLLVKYNEQTYYRESRTSLSSCQCDIQSSPIGQKAQSTPSIRPNSRKYDYIPFSSLVPIYRVNFDSC
jgi:hypothetical protein